MADLQVRGGSCRVWCTIRRWLLASSPASELGGSRPLGSHYGSAALLHFCGILAEFKDKLEGITGDAVACLQWAG
jgi:hypothetical protein